MEDTETFTVREVREDDLPALAAIEKERWEREGTDILTQKQLEQWYKSGSPFFLVAERDGEIGGFYYAIQVHFSLDAIEDHAGDKAQTHHGWSIHTHDPAGESVCGVNLVQRNPYAGSALSAKIHKLIREKKMLYFIGVLRLVNLDHYLRQIEKLHGGVLPYKEEEIALWYVHESMKLLGQTKTWTECTPQPKLLLPPLRRPDTLLKFSVQALQVGLLRIIPDFMKDPKSRNYGAFFASDFT